MPSGIDISHRCRKEIAVAGHFFPTMGKIGSVPTITDKIKKGRRSELYHLFLQLNIVIALFVLLLLNSGMIYIPIHVKNSLTIGHFKKSLNTYISSVCVCFCASCFSALGSRCKALIQGVPKFTPPL